MAARGAVPPRQTALRPRSPLRTAAPPRAHGPPSRSAPAWPPAARPAPPRNRRSAPRRPAAPRTGPPVASSPAKLSWFLAPTAARGPKRAALRRRRNSNWYIPNHASLAQLLSPVALVLRRRPGADGVGEAEGRRVCDTLTGEGESG